MTKRTQEQNKRIYGLLNQLGKVIGKENAALYKARACVEVSGQEHSSALSYFQADDMIKKIEAELEKLGYNSQMNIAPVKTTDKTGFNGMLNWINQSYKDLYILYKVPEPAQKAFSENFNKRIIKRAEITTAYQAHKIFEALKDAIVRKIDHADILKRINEIIIKHNDKLNDWERTALWDYRTQLMTKGKLDSAAKIKKVLEMYDKYSAKGNAQSEVSRRGAEGAEE